MSLMQLGCEPPLLVYPNSSSSSRVHVMAHNWSATKQCPHPQSVAETNHHSVLPEDRIRQRETLPGSHYKDRSVSASCHYNPQALQCSRCARKRSGRDHCFRGRSESGCRIVGSHTRWDLTTWADFQLCLHRKRTNAWLHFLKNLWLHYIPVKLAPISKTSTAALHLV